MLSGDYVTVTANRIGKTGKAGVADSKDLSPSSDKRTPFGKDGGSFLLPINPPTIDLTEANEEFDEYLSNMRKEQAEAERLADAVKKAAEALATLTEERRNWRDYKKSSLTGEYRQGDMAALEAISDHGSDQVGRDIEALDKDFQKRYAARRSMVEPWKSAILEAIETGDWGAALKDVARENMLKALDPFAEKLAEIFADLTDWLSKALVSLFSGMGSSSGGGGGGGGIFGSIVGAILGGGFGGGGFGLGNGYAWAGGGGFNAGDWGIVGEEGPELVKWKGAGTVIPADVTRAALSTRMRAPTGADARTGTTNIFNAPGADAAALRRLEMVVRQMDAGFDGRAVQAAYNAQQRDILE